MEILLLSEKIELLKKEMIELALKEGNLSHPSVVALSQELDIFVFKFQIFLKDKKIMI